MCRKWLGGWVRTGTLGSWAMEFQGLHWAHIGKRIGARGFEVYARRHVDRQYTCKVNLMFAHIERTDAECYARPSGAMWHVGLEVAARLDNVPRIVLDWNADTVRSSRHFFSLLARFLLLASRGCLWQWPLFQILPCLTGDRLATVPRCTEIGVWRLALLCVIPRSPANCLLHISSESVALLPSFALAAVMRILPPGHRAGIDRLSCAPAHAYDCSSPARRGLLNGGLGNGPLLDISRRRRGECVGSCLHCLRVHGRRVGG